MILEKGSEIEPMGHLFPPGLRVLAVDHDSTSLKLLEILLNQCQYHGLFLNFFFRWNFENLLYCKVSWPSMVVAMLQWWYS